MQNLIRIIKDTREQDGWDFDSYNDVKVYRDTLTFGDYTMPMCEFPHFDESIIIERKKNCRELLNNLGSGWEQFENELRGACKYKHKLIIVCGPNNFQYLVERRITPMSLQFLYSRLAYIYTEYGIATSFFTDKFDAEQYAYRLFRNITKRLENE